MLIITGAAGFIGSCMAGTLNMEGREDLVLVDAFTRPDKRPNYEGKSYLEAVERMDLFTWLEGKENSVEAIIHLGARTDTAEQDVRIFDRLNLHYSQHIWNWCTRHQVPLVYASSAATYGGGEQGFNDQHAEIEALHPLNPYGNSKQQFDQWVLAQSEHPPYWAGLKFFNVYGPNEYHKGRMASVIFHAYHQILATKQMKLFRSHRSDVADGEQKRDFIYVQDVIKVIRFMLQDKPPSGIYNLGTGQARHFNDLARGVFSSLGMEEKIVYIDTPEDIRETYQYFTEARMDKLRQAGYTDPFYSLEAGIAEYVKRFLVPEAYL